MSTICKKCLHYPGDCEDCRHANHFWRVLPGLILLVIALYLWAHNIDVWAHTLPASWLGE